MKFLIRDLQDFFDYLVRFLKELNTIKYLSHSTMIIQYSSTTKLKQQTHIQQ